MPRRVFLLSTCLVPLLLAGCNPTVRFTADQTSGDAPLDVQFADDSATLSRLGIDYSVLAPVTAWIWDFGDGGGSTEKDPAHTYTNPGTYSVSLTVSNLFGAAVETQEDLIVVRQGLQANFTVDATAGISPFTANFTDASAAGTNPIVSWAWDFGDGGGSTEQHPAHTYTKAGTYTVSLTVTANASSADAETSTVTDTSTAEDLITVEEGGLQAAFKANTARGIVPLKVAFTDQSAGGTDDIESWLWDFGDGSSSTSKNPAHTYNDPGTYTVTLSVETATAKDKETKVDYITVLPKLEAQFTHEQTDDAWTVQFTDTTDTSGEQVTSRLWDFGDGETSTAESPIHTFPEAGTYEVSLTLTTALAQSTVKINVQVT